MDIRLFPLSGRASFTIFALFFFFSFTRSRHTIPSQFSNPSAHTLPSSRPSVRTLSTAPCIPAALPPLQPPSPHLPNLLANYVRRHAAARARIAAGHPIPPVLIWRCPRRRVGTCGGVGDRMRGIRFSLLVAILSGRPFFIEWPSQPFPLLSALVPSQIDWTIPKSLESRLPRHFPGEYKPPANNHLAWQKGFDLSNAPVWKNKHVNLNQVNLTALLNNHAPISTIVSLCGHFGLRALVDNPTMPSELVTKYGRKASGAGKYARALSSLLFAPSAEVERRMRQHNFHANTSYIAVHIRTGQDVYESKLSRFKVFREQTHLHVIAKKLVECVRVASNLNGGLRNVFFTSDSQLFNNLFRTLGEKKGLVVRAATGRVLHISRAGEWRLDGGHNLPLRCDRFLSVFVDIMKLSRGVTVVATRSGFSESAFFIGKAKRSYVLHPSKDGGKCEEFLNLS